MRQKIKYSLILGAALAAAGVAQAELSAATMKEDKTHVSNWNQFAEACLELHKAQVAKYDVRKETSVGGYHNKPEFFLEEKYYDKDTGKLISRVQWEREDPEKMHTIEVYVRDDQGRVVRDYAAAFLPHYRNAPVQTLINLHGYSNGVHGFRQFDASGDRIYEACEGTFEGEEVQLRLFEKDLLSNDRRIEELMSSPVYEACFGSIPTKVGEYLTPQ